MRLQKFMAQCGVASRRQCEEYIASGRVLVNGNVASLGTVIDETTDTVVFDGEELSIKERRVVLLFYKPRGVVCTSQDPEGRKTVLSYFKDFSERLYSVGRLDINSEGLLIMTNDGELALKIAHPRHEVTKTYYAVIDSLLSENKIALLKNGVDIGDGITAPAQVTRVGPTKTGHCSFLITIHEGRNRQVRRMIEAVGHSTLLLKRERIGKLSLNGLKPGEWRYPSAEELEWLNEIKDSNN